MFKKLKDRIAEEVKQSPRIQASVQQLSHYSLFNEGGTPDGSKTDLFLPFSSSPIAAASDNSPFSIGEDDEVDQSVAVKDGAPFEVVDLGQTTSTPVASGDASIFPIYQSSYSSFQLPSDLESNASEIDEAATMYREKYSQEQVIQAYQRMRTRYQKYKGRYADTARAYQELERENDKMKTVLAETQDKALRRMNELKEQCQLEQKAKAHLEETLRADIEEKDHKILTLNTKVDILKSNGASALQDLQGEEAVLRKKDEETSTDEAEPEEVSNNLNVKTEYEEKINRLEALLLKSKDIIKTNKAKVLQLSEEGESMRKQMESDKKCSEELKNEHMKELEVLQNDLIAAREEIKALRQQEEQNALAMAQTKHTMHKELEEKELKNLNLTESVSKLTIENDSLQKQLKKMNDDLEHQQSTNEEDKKNALHELSRGKAAALQLLKHEMEEKMKEKEEEWQQNYSKKVKEVEQKADDDVHKKMSEFKNQHQMELDEKELQKMAALSEADKSIQDRDRTIEALTRQKLELEEQLSQHEDSHSAACKSWEIRETELDEKQQLEIQEIKNKHEEELEEVSRKYQEEMETHAMQFKEKYVKRLAELRSEHEEALQGASSQQEEEYKKKTDLLVAQYSQDISNLKMSLIALEDEKKEGLAEKDNIIMNCQKDVEESKVKCSRLIVELEAANAQMEECEQEIKEKLEALDQCSSIEKAMKSEINQAVESVEGMKLLLKKKEEEYDALEIEKKCKQEKFEVKLEEVRKESETTITQLQEEFKKEQENRCKEHEIKIALEESLTERDSQIDHLNQELLSMKEKCKENLELISKKEEALQKLNQDVEVLRTQLLAAKDDENAASEIKLQFDKMKADMEDNRQKFRAELEERECRFKEDIEKKQAEIVKLKEERQNLEAELGDEKSRVAGLEEKIQREKEEESEKILKELECLQNVCGTDYNNADIINNIQNVSIGVIALIESLKGELKSKEQANSAQLESLEQVKAEKVQLQRESETSMQRLQTELDKSKCDHESTLQAVEEEMGKMKARSEELERNIENGSQEKEQQVQEFKTLLECKENLIQDLRYRECEISNLLERTRNESELKVAEINSKMDSELFQMQEKMEELNAEVDMLRAHLDSSKIAHEEAVRKYQQNESEQISLLKSRNLELENDMKSMQETLNRNTEEQRSSVEEQSKMLADLKTAHNREIESLSKQLQDAAEAAKTRLQEVEQESEAKTKVLQVELNQICTDRKQEVEALSKELKNAAEVAESKLHDLERESKAKTEELARELNLVCDEKESINSDHEELKSKMNKLEEKLRETEEDVQSYEKRNSELIEQVGALKQFESETVKLKQELHGAEEERDSLKRVLEQSDDVSESMKKEVDILTEKVMRSQSELERSNETNSNLEASIAKLRKDYESSQEQLKSANSLLEEKISLIKEEQRKLGSLEEERNMLQGRWEQADKEVSILKDESEAAKEESASLQELLNHSEQKCVLIEAKEKEHEQLLEEIESNRKELLEQVAQLERYKHEQQIHIEEIEGIKEKLEEQVKEIEDERNELDEKFIQMKTKVDKRHEDMIDKEILVVQSQLKQKEEEIMELSDRLDNEIETSKAWQTEVEEVQSRLVVKEKEMLSQNSEWQTKYADLKKKAELKLTMIKKQLTAEKDKEVSEAVKANNEMSIEAQELEELRSENWHLHEKVEELENAVRKSEASIAQEKATEELEEKHYRKIKELAKNLEIQMSETEMKHQEELDQAVNNAQEIAASQMIEMREDLKRSSEMLHDKSQALEDSFENHQKELEAKDLKLSELTKFYQAQLQATERNWKQLLDEQRLAMEKRHHEELDGLTEEWQKERLQMERTYVTTKEREMGGHSSSSGESNGSENANLEGLIELEYLRNILYQYMMGKEPLVLAKVIATVVRFSRGQTERVLQREEQKHGVLGVGLNRKS